MTSDAYPTLVLTPDELAEEVRQDADAVPARMGATGTG
jgi:hypothetical protein